MKPDIITFLAPAGGAGRTTAVMALASTIVEEKCLPPLVIDATPETRLRPARDTTLGRWQQQMYQSGVKRSFLSVYQATDPDELTALLSKHRHQRFPDFGTILIDTGGRLDDLALTASAHSDLLIAPFMDALTALRSSEALDGVGLGDAPLYGLKCGDACNDADHRAVSAAFTAGRLFIHGLPSSPQLEDISVDPRAFRRAVTRISALQGRSLVSAVDVLDQRMDKELGRNWKTHRQAFREIIDFYGQQRVLNRDGDSPQHIFRTTTRSICERSGLADFYRNTLKPLVSRLIDSMRSKQALRPSQYDPDASPKSKGSGLGL